MMDRGNSDSDEEEPQDKPQNNPFSKSFEGVLFRKIVIKNLSSDNLLMVASIKSTIPEPNFEPANVELSFEVKSESNFVITLKKHNVEENFEDFKLELKMLGAATKEGYWPRQLITEVPQQKNQEEDKDSSDN